MAHRRLLQLLGIGLGTALFAWMAARMPFAPLRERAAALPAWSWLGAALGLAASHALRAARLHAEWSARCGARYGECLRIGLVHTAWASLLPLRSGELSYAWLLHRRFGVSLLDAGKSLLRLRLQDVVVLCVLALLWLAPTVPALRVLAAMALLAGALLVLRGSGATWVYGASNWMLKLLVIAALLSQLAGLPVAPALAGALAGELAAVLPLQAPAGIGSYEGGVWLGAGGWPHGADAGVLFGAALVVHALLLAVSCAGALLASAWPQRVRGALSP
ncbi:MAG TPA: lysylphosphatidylglycerol synthase domain-containing protein [Burkholderiaceae bacterium]|nr:lysylphosphatidylglycerol synthase domain-containing protein [Burkholderiaceae bacterium]